MSKLTGRVVHPEDPGWDNARRNFNSSFDYDAMVPSKVVFCQAPEDVCNAVRWAREKGVEVRVRCGRHAYEPYTLAPKALIIDVSDMEAVTVDTDSETANTGAGVFMIDLYEKLFEVGRTVPGASGASVGLSGLALGGGFGATSRLWGLTCDNMEELDLVDANGDLLTVNAGNYPDLFWACRGGGGGNFGIATRFRLKVHPVANCVILNITWAWDAFERLVDTWQGWAPAVEDGLATFLRLGANRVVTLLGQFTAPNTELPRINQLLLPMLAAAPPTSVSIQAAPFIVATRIFAGVDPLYPQWLLHPHNDRQVFKSTSAIARKPFEPAAIATLKQRMEAAPHPSWQTNQPSMVQLLGGGGEVARVPPESTAVFHRDAVFVVQYDAYWMSPEDDQENIEWVEDTRDALIDSAEGAYVNYLDGRLKDPLRAYYGPYLERLVEVKRRYDPDNFFHHPHSIPVTL